MVERRTESLAGRDLTLADLSQVISGARARQQLTQRQLAQLADVSRPWIVSVEAGKARMDMAMVLRVLAALGLAPASAITLEGPAGQRSTPSKAGLDAKPKKSTCRYVIEVRSAKGVSLVLTTVEWTKERRRLAINQILRLAGFAKPAVDEPPKGRSLAEKNTKSG